MIIASLTAGSTTASTPVAFTVTKNTNGNLSVQNNTISVVQPGLYRVTGEATVTSSGAANTGLQINANNVISGNQFYYTASAASITETVPILTYVNVVESSTAGVYAAIQILPVGAPTIVAGTISIEKVS